MPKLHERLRGLVRDELKKRVPESIQRTVRDVQEGKPLHQMVRERLPESIEKRIPESMRPPAWGEGKPEPPEWARGQRGDVRWVPGDPAMVWSEKPGGGTVAMHDSKGKELKTPLQLAMGTEGRIVAVGDVYVVFQAGENEGASRVRVPKEDLIPQKPEDARRWARRPRLVLVRAEDLGS